MMNAPKHLSTPSQKKKKKKASSWSEMPDALQLLLDPLGFITGNRQIFFGGFYTAIPYLYLSMSTRQVA